MRARWTRDKSGQRVVIKVDLYYGFTTSECVKKIEKKDFSGDWDNVLMPGFFLKSLKIGFIQKIRKNIFETEYKT